MGTTELAARAIKSNRHGSKSLIYYVMNYGLDDAAIFALTASKQAKNRTMKNYYLNVHKLLLKPSSVLEAVNMMRFL